MQVQPRSGLCPLCFQMRSRRDDDHARRLLREHHPRRHKREGRSFRPRASPQPENRPTGCPDNAPPRHAATLEAVRYPSRRSSVVGSSANLPVTSTSWIPSSGVGCKVLVALADPHQPPHRPNFFPSWRFLSTLSSANLLLSSLPG